MIGLVFEFWRLIWYSCGPPFVFVLLDFQSAVRGCRRLTQVQCMPYHNGYKNCYSVCIIEGTVLPFYVVCRVFIPSCLFWFYAVTLHQICTSLLVSSLPDLWELAVMYLHCRLWDWKLKKMIRARLKPAVKDHITVSLWLEPTVFWLPLITVDSSKEPTVIVIYHYRF